MLTGLVAVLGAAGWVLWFLARQDAKAARVEALEASSRARIADAKAAAARAGEASAQCTARAAEAQTRVAHVEARSLRIALADAAARKPNGEAGEPDDLYDSTTGKLRIYRVRSEED